MSKEASKGSPSCPKACGCVGLGHTKRGVFSWLEDKRKCETSTAENYPFWNPQRSGLLSPGPGPRPSLRPGFCHGRLPAALPGLLHMSRERQEAGPSDTYLTRADGEESAWDAFTSPSGGAQQEPTEPAAPKSDFHTSSSPRTC